MHLQDSLHSAPTPRRRVLLSPFTFIGRLSESRHWAYVLIVPSLILVFAVVIYPILTGILLSFQDYRLTRPDRMGFIGLKNYADLLADPVFFRSLTNTALYTVVGTIGPFVLGLATALALNRSGLFMKIAGVVILLPWLLPSVVAGNIWALMLDARLGVINDVLLKLGLINEYRAWFATTDTAMWSVLAISIWRGFPFFTLLLLAGIQGIPEDLFEAASVDGASRWDKFRYITMPLLRPIVVATVILRVIFLVNTPDLLLILTNGGPGHATQVLSLYAFQSAYLNFNFGYAGTLSVVMFIILMIFTVIYVRVSRLSEE